MPLNICLQSHKIVPIWQPTGPSHIDIARYMMKLLNRQDTRDKLTRRTYNGMNKCYPNTSPIVAVLIQQFTNIHDIHFHFWNNGIKWFLSALHKIWRSRMSELFSISSSNTGQSSVSSWWALALSSKCWVILHLRAWLRNMICIWSGMKECMY